MEFCSKCGSVMKEDRDSLLCPKCGNVVQVPAGTHSKSVKIEHIDSVYVVSAKENQQSEQVKVLQVCPKCGNGEAYRWYSGVSGEHAGIRREVTVEHFKCAKCSYTWSRSY